MKNKKIIIFSIILIVVVFVISKKYLTFNMPENMLRSELLDIDKNEVITFHQKKCGYNKAIRIAPCFMTIYSAPNNWLKKSNNILLSPNSYEEVKLFSQESEDCQSFYKSAGNWLEFSKQPQNRRSNFLITGGSYGYEFESKNGVIERLRIREKGKEYADFTYFPYNKELKPPFRIYAFPKSKKSQSSNIFDSHAYRIDYKKNTKGCTVGLYRVAVDESQYLLHRNIRRKHDSVWNIEIFKTENNKQERETLYTNRCAVRFSYKDMPFEQKNILNNVQEINVVSRDKGQAIVVKPQDYFDCMAPDAMCLSAKNNSTLTPSDIEFSSEVVDDLYSLGSGISVLKEIERYNNRLLTAGLLIPNSIHVNDITSKIEIIYRHNGKDEKLRFIRVNKNEKPSELGGIGFKFSNYQFLKISLPKTIELSQDVQIIWRFLGDIDSDMIYIVGKRLPKESGGICSSATKQGRYPLDVWQLNDIKESCFSGRDLTGKTIITSAVYCAKAEECKIFYNNTLLKLFSQNKQLFWDTSILPQGTNKYIRSLTLHKLMRLQSNQASPEKNKEKTRKKPNYVEKIYAYDGEKKVVIYNSSEGLLKDYRTPEYNLLNLVGDISSNFSNSKHYSNPCSIDDRNAVSSCPLINQLSGYKGEKEIHLALSLPLQKIVVEAVKKRTEYYLKQYPIFKSRFYVGKSSVSAVVMNAKTGEILAGADSNYKRKPVFDEQFDFRLLSTEFNRSSFYEPRGIMRWVPSYHNAESSDTPGSTFKLVTSLSLLEHMDKVSRYDRCQGISNPCFGHLINGESIRKINSAFSQFKVRLDAREYPYRGRHPVNDSGQNFRENASLSDAVKISKNSYFAWLHELISPATQSFYDESWKNKPLVYYPKNYNAPLLRHKEIIVNEKIKLLPAARILHKFRYDEHINLLTGELEGVTKDYSFSQANKTQVWQLSPATIEASQIVDRNNLRRFAIGVYGVKVAPLHMAGIAASISQKRVVYPRLTKKTDNNNYRQANDNKITFGISPLINGMWRAANEIGGTSYGQLRRVRNINSYCIYAKTGTAKYKSGGNYLYNSWLTGFFYKKINAIDKCEYENGSGSIKGINKHDIYSFVCSVKRNRLHGASACGPVIVDIINGGKIW